MSNVEIVPIVAEAYTTYFNVSFLEDETKYVATPKDRIITILIMLFFIMELDIIYYH